jgi:hypothetical protein
VTLCEALEALAGEAQRALAHRHTLGFGPIPLTLQAGGLEPLHTFAGSLVASPPASWPPLQVTLLSGAELPLDRVPEQIRPCGNEVLLARGEGCTLLSSGPDRSLWLFQPGRSAAVFWTVGFAALPPWERISPLRAAARWWAALQGGAMTHAGVVGDGARCVLLVGPAGAGKSTSTLACLGSGLQVLGDDYCLLQAPGAATAAPSQGPIAYGMYRYAKLDERSLALLPALRRRVVGRGWSSDEVPLCWSRGARQGKWLVDLGEAPVPSASVVAVCDVRQDPHGSTRLEPLSRMETLRALAPSTIVQQRLWERETFQALTATIRCVPTFRLLVNEPREVPDQVRRLLARTAP